MVSKSSLIKCSLALIFISLLEPTAINDTPLHTIMYILRYVGYAISALTFLKYKMYRDVPCMGLLVFLAWMVVTTFAYSHTFSSNLLYIMSLLIPAIILSTYCINFYPKFFVYTVAAILSLWIFLDGVTWKPEGVSLTADGARAFFLGTKTTITYYLVPAFTFDFIALEITPRKKKAFPRLLLFMTVFGAVIYLVNEPISTAIVCGILCVVGYYSVCNIESTFSVVYRFGFIATSIINAMFIAGNSMTLFTDFFKNVLGERDGLNGRTSIWSMVLLRIIDRPVIGHGYSSGIHFDVFQSYNTSTHNFFLYILFTMGIVGFVIYIGYIYIIHRNNKRYQHIKASRYLIFVIVVLNIEAITEAYGFNVMTFLVLLLAINTPKIAEYYRH